MNVHVIKLLLFQVSLFTLKGYSQEANAYAVLDPEFRFSDGIYLNFEQLKNNSPVEKGSLLIAENFNKREFFRDILQAKSIMYRNESGENVTIVTKSIFGFATNGVLNIMTPRGISYQIYPGRICFLSLIKQETSSENKFIAIPSFIEKDGNRNSPGTNKSYKMLKYKWEQSYLLDFGSGNLYKFSIRSLKALLAYDRDLIYEFKALSCRERRRQAYYFIGEFNKNNPLFLPLGKIRKD